MIEQEQLARVPLHRRLDDPAPKQDQRPWFLVGITGLAGAGKAAAAAALVARGYRAIAFADALRHQVVLTWGIGVEVLTAPHGKHVAREALAFSRCNDTYFRAWAFLNGLAPHAPQSPRAVMQAWGDFVRSADPTQFVRAVDRWIVDQLRRGHRHLVVTDVRTPAEARLVKQRDGVLLRVYRPEQQANDPHCTEQTHTLPIDGAVVNDGSPVRLSERVLGAVQDLMGPAACEVGL